MWLVFFSSYVTARDVEVTGTSTIADARVERAAEVPTGTPLARVDLGAIRARVESIAAVKSAEVSRSWPHTVRIAVTERTPVAVIDRGAGLQALDADGVLFGHYEARPERLPLVAHRSRPGRRGARRGRPGGRLAAGRGSPCGSTTVEVASVDKIQLVLGNGRRVLWGSAEDSDPEGRGARRAPRAGPASRSTSPSRVAPPPADPLADRTR